MGAEEVEMGGRSVLTLLRPSGFTSPTDSTSTRARKKKRDRLSAIAAWKRRDREI